MKFSISQPVLAEALAKGGLAARKSNDIPILAGVRLVTRNDTLSIASTDGDRFVEIATGADIESPGACVVGATALTALISRYPKDGLVSVDLEAPGLLRVKCGRSRVGLGALSANGFPDWTRLGAEASTFDVEGPAFVGALGRMRALSGFPWDGVFVDPADGWLNVAAFNGYAMGWLRLALPEGAAEAPTMMLSSVSIEGISRLFKAEHQVSVSVSDSVATFDAGGVRFATKLLVGKTPPYAMIPSLRGDKTVTFNRNEFLTCMDRAVLATEEGTYSSVIVIPREGGVIELKTMNSKGGEVRETLDAEIVDGFAAMGFNPDYIGAILAGLTAERIIVEEVQVERNKRYIVHSDEQPDFIASFAPVTINAAMAA